MERRVLCVTGISGGGAVLDLLRLRGVAEADSAAFTAVGSDVAAALGAAHGVPPGLPPGWGDAEELAPLRARAAALVAALPGRAVAWHDPGAALVLPFWQRVTPLVTVLSVPDPAPLLDGPDPAAVADRWLRTLAEALRADPAAVVVDPAAGSLPPALTALLPAAPAPAPGPAPAAAAPAPAAAAPAPAAAAPAPAAGLVPAAALASAAALAPAGAAAVAAHRLLVADRAGAGRCSPGSRRAGRDTRRPGGWRPRSRGCRGTWRWSARPPATPTGAPTASTRTSSAPAASWPSPATGSTGCAPGRGSAPPSRSGAGSARCATPSSPAAGRAARTGQRRRPRAPGPCPIAGPRRRTSRSSCRSTTRRRSCAAA